MGSKEIWNLFYRQGFAFVGVKGRKECVEARAGADPKSHVEVTQVFAVSNHFDLKNCHLHIQDE